MLSDEDRDGVRWAADYIRVHANMDMYPIIWEDPTSLILDDFTEVPGTPDAVCHLDIFDLKWRQFHYDAQMALYAAARLQGLSATASNGQEIMVRVHLLFACFKRVEVLKFTWDTAAGTVRPIVDACNNPEKKPVPCSYCNWCANRLTCSALNERAQAVGNGREDWQLEQYHTSQISSPAEMAKALTLARHLIKWAEAVEYHARQLAIKDGVTIPGYELKSKAGRSSCADILGAFNASGLTPEDFMQCCDVRLETSKENPDKRGLADVLAHKKGISKAAAKREVKSTLQPFMRTPKEILYLKATKETEETTYA